MNRAAPTCPSCQADLPDTLSFTRWCPACDWNVEPDNSWVEWRESSVDKLVARITRAPPSASTAN